MPLRHPAEVNGRISHVFYERVSNDADVPFLEMNLACAFVSSTVPSPLDHMPLGHPAEVNGKISHVFYEKVSNDADIPV